MNNNNREIINKIASKIRIIYDLSDNDFDLLSFVNSLGGQIEYSSFTKDEACIMKVNNTFKIIIDNSISNSNRIRFSIAHELGHLFLHMKFKIDNVYWSNIPNGVAYSRNTNVPYSKLESEANEFAAAFLMPKDKFILFSQENLVDNIFDIDAIARYFNVSCETVIVRGKVLGLWE